MAANPFQVLTFEGLKFPVHNYYVDWVNVLVPSIYGR